MLQGTAQMAPPPGSLPGTPAWLRSPLCGLSHPSPARSGSALPGDESGPGRVEPGLSPLPLCVPSTQPGTGNARGEKRMARVRVSVSVKRLQVPGATLCTVALCLGPRAGLPVSPTRNVLPPLPDLPALF